MSHRAIWACYAVAVAAAFAIVGVASVKMVAYEARHRQDLAERENRRRTDLALFRMESRLAPILAAENTRPYFHYRPQFPVQDPQRLYLGQVVADREAMQNSPLSGSKQALIKSHFELGPNQQFYSVSPSESQEAEQQFAMTHQTTLAACTTPAAAAPATTKWAPVGPGITQVAREWQIRSMSRMQQAVAMKTGGPARQDEIRIIEGVVTGAWMGGELVVARQVRIGDGTWLQGAVLDWPAVQTELLRTITDLLPNARLQPVSEGATAAPDTLDRLAALPIALVPGASFASRDSPAGGAVPWLRFTWNCCPIVWPLWGSALALAFGVALLLRAMISLDRRRAEFVATVTHELRTPLTTLRMYVDMQRAGMVRDEHQLAEYMTILDQESGRLVHLVENVLAYARLDQGRASDRIATTSIAELIHEAQSHLQAHVDRQSATIAFELPPELAATAIRCDTGSVGQILFNLVDNACKYGQSLHQPTIAIRCAEAAESIEIQVVDHGVGVPAAFQKRLFEPFERAGEVAAGESPGIGLGLALCRRLARSFGGDLAYRPATTGATFVLTLPKTHD